MKAPANITQLLAAWSDGDPAALEALTPLVHQELHRLAGACMAGERPGHLLQATAVVNEEAAHVLDVSVGTVRREWSLAQAWLFRELGGAA